MPPRSQHTKGTRMPRLLSSSPWPLPPFIPPWLLLALLLLARLPAWELLVAQEGPTKVGTMPMPSLAGTSPHPAAEEFGISSSPSRFWMQRRTDPEQLTFRGSFLPCPSLPSELPAQGVRGLSQPLTQPCTFPSADGAPPRL